MATEVNDIKDQNEESKIEILKEKVDSLYSFRDLYFETHSLDDAKHKAKSTEMELRTVLDCFESFKKLESGQARATYYYLLGRAHNVMTAYSIKAEDALSKAVKLDPKMVDAWNELGECYWKKDNVREAKDCFIGALSHRRNKVSLRNLSMVLRQEFTSTTEARASNVEQGLAHSKEAVQLDTRDGMSWAVLGNAYISAFFTLVQDPHTLKLSLSAYQQAEKDAVARNNPDLHYNKAIALKYGEDYESALASFSRAHILDPTWMAPSLMEQRLLKFLDNVEQLVTLKGKVKGKKLQQLLKSLDQKQLGPYQEGSYTVAKSGQSISVKEMPLAELNPGENRGAVVLGKVVCGIHNEDSVPFTFCLLDHAQTCVAVTVYNLAQGRGVIIGDSVAIPEPNLAHVHFRVRDKSYDFRSIRVETPLLLAVNGKLLGPDQQASAHLSCFKKV